MPVPSVLTESLAATYRLDRELGAGGMATVYLARDLRHDRDVAIKVLHPELAAALGADRFLAEIKTTARLQHPHILPLLDSGSSGGFLYYVMPLATGETLRARLERERQLPIEDAIHIAREVADALGAAHAIGIVHRDIKPENILLQGGHAVVADFGIALAVQQAGGQRMTQTGLSLGTPQYMSPEQAMGERSIDARSDLYSLGAVLYEMLIGEPPFTGPTVQTIVAKVMTERPVAPTSLRDTVPPHVEHAILKALAKLPADRWASVGDFSKALADSHFAAAIPHARAHVRLRSRSLALGAVLLGGGILAGWLAARLGAPLAADPPALVTSILPPRGGNFSEQQSLALSPDGRRLAFVFAANDGSRNLWLRDLERLEPSPISGTTNADIPFWSPDGRSLGFFANGFLNVMSPGGDIRRLCPVGDPNAGSWGGTDLILFSDRSGISSVSSEGGQCRRIIPYDTGSVMRAVLLPDGKRMVYSRGRFADLTVADLDGKTLGQLPVQAQLFGVAEPDYLIFSDPGDAGALDIQRMDLSTLRLTGSAARLLNGVRSRAGLHTFSLSREGSLVYLPGGVDQPYLEYDATGLRDTVRISGTWTVSPRPRGAGPATIAIAGNLAGVWIYELATRRTARVAIRDTALQLSGGNQIGATWPVFSPDGTRLAYTMSYRGQCGINEHDLTRDTDRTITRTTFVTMYFCLNVLDWSRDGSRLLVKNDTALEVMTLDGQVTNRIARPGLIWEGHFSPDGKSVAFSSDETGRAEVYAAPIAGGLPARLSLEGARWPAWTSDGKRVMFMTPTGNVQEVAMRGNSPSGTPRTLFTVENWRRSTFDDRGVGFAMVGDGERYIVRQSSSGIAVAYVQNWHSLLDQATAAPRP